MPIEAEGEPLAQRAKGAKTQNKNNNNRGRNPRFAPHAPEHANATPRSLGTRAQPD